MYSLLSWWIPSEIQYLIWKMEIIVLNTAPILLDRIPCSFEYLCSNLCLGPANNIQEGCPEPRLNPFWVVVADSLVFSHGRRDWESFRSLFYKSAEEAFTPVTPSPLKSSSTDTIIFGFRIPPYTF